MRRGLLTVLVALVLVGGIVYFGTHEGAAEKALAWSPRLPVWVTHPASLWQDRPDPAMHGAVQVGVTADAEAFPMASWIVSGAGTVGVNGTYAENGTYNGKPKYEYGPWKLRWSGTVWEIWTTLPPPNGVTAYHGTGADLPATPWSVDAGSSPAPTVSADTHDISGQVTVDTVGQDGVVVSLTGDATDSDTTAGGGLYSFADLADGAYVVTPSFPAYSYAPASREITLAGADATGQDFAGTPNPHAAAFGSILKIDGVPVAEVVRLTPSTGGDALDVTGHSSPDAHREFAGGLRGGELSIAAIYTQSGYGLLKAAVMSRALALWRIEYPNGDWWTCNGLCLTLSNPTPVDDALRCSASVRLSGRPTCSWQT